MTKKEWIIRAIEENDYDLDTILSAEMYNKYCEETGSSAFYRSYYKDVRKYYNDLNDGEENFKYSPSFPNNEISEEEKTRYAEYSEEELIGILEEEIQKRSSSLQYKDIKQIAEERGIPFRAFAYQIPDLKNILKKLYSINLFHVENDQKVEKVQHDNKVMKRELNFYKNKNILDEKLVEVLQEAIIEYKPLKFNKPNINKNNFNKTSESVVLLSDFHWDEVVDYEQMLGINEYSLEIAQRRIDTLFKQFIQNAQVYGITTINLLLLGDMISGELHDLAENSEVGIIKGVLQLADYISQHIQNLSRHFDKIKILGLVGNHSRTHIKPRYKNKQTQNYEYILYEFIKREVKNIAEFDLPESYMKLHNIQGFEFLSLHGDIIKGGNGLNSTPGNLSRDISLLGGTLSQVGENFQYVNMGHFHTSNITKAYNGAKIIMNGSLIGPNEFSLGALKKGEPPTQTFYIVEREKGMRFIDFIDCQ